MPDSESAPSALPATAAVHWLVHEALTVSAPGTLLGELCNRLTAEGVPIASAHLKIASLDPLIAETRLLWQRDTARVVEEVVLHGMPSLEKASSISNGLCLPLSGTGHEI